MKYSEHEDNNLPFRAISPFPAKNTIERMWLEFKGFLVVKAAFFGFGSKQIIVVSL